jgi:hypothetical protein
VPPVERSRRRIDASDLARLGEIARADRERMFARNDRWSAYRGRLLCVALCQGAALHFVNHGNGVKDFDVWTFFARSPRRPHPDPALYRRNKPADYGRSPFGRTPGAPGWVRGRRVDLLARSLDVPARTDPAQALRTWLLAGREKSARMLARKAVVLIEPHPGLIVWTPSAMSRSEPGFSSGR